LKVIPNHEIRIGQQKTQFGYENTVSSSRLFAVNRTEISDNLSRGKNLRDIGLGLLGNIPLSNRFRIEDAITVVNGAGMNVQDDDSSQKNVLGRCGIRCKRSNSWVRFGISGGTGDYVDEGDDILDPSDDFVLKFQRVGTDIEIDHKWVFLSTEYVYGTDRVEDEQDEISGYYINLVGKTHWHVGPIVRLDSLADEYLRWTFGAYYGDAKDRFRLLLNYEFRKIMEDPSGHIGHGDDKLYLWTQVKF
jgi:hypothetical protein